MNMETRFNQIGLSSQAIEAIIDNELNANADLLIGIDDPEVLEMVQVLKKAVAKAIHENNRKVDQKLDELFQKNKRFGQERQNWTWMRGPFS